MMKQLVGQSLDRYKIISLLGEGGMGAVFKARDITLQRDVAIKIMHPQFARRPDFQERFLQEARTAARMSHPGIVQVHDFGQARSHLYIVMEFIAGDNLRQMLQNLRATNQWIVLPEAIQIVQQVSLALDYAHRQGVLHRDIKPDNVMLKAEPSEGLPYRPVITDLGLAKLAEGGIMTVEGTSMGTPAYMSPEQAMGQKTDARSDVYSLGILLYELAVGQLPFPVRTITEAIRYHTKEPPPPPRSIRPDLPEPVERVILKGVEKDPANRFPDAKALAQAMADTLPAASVATAAPTAMEGAVSLMTQYQQSLVEARGPSILDEFPEPPADLRQDRIVIMAQDRTIHSVSMKPQGLTIGRSADNDVALDDSKVSRHHTRIEFDGTNYQVVDLNSTNGTYLANVKLLPGVPEVWTPDKPLRIGNHWLRLERAQQPAMPGRSVMFRSDGTMVAPSLIRSSVGPARVGVFMEISQLSVEPGSSTTASAIILNQGAVVDHFQTSVEGVPANWVPVTPPPVRLMPGAQQEVTLTIQPPRSPQSQAGDYPLTIRVASQDAPDQVAEVKGTLTVAAYSQFSSDLRPQKIRAGKTAQVTVQNQGNTRQTFTLTWQDRADELAFKPPQAQLTVPEGQMAAAEFRAVPRHRRWIGGTKTHPFSTDVRSPEGETQTRNGEVLSKGLIPAWAPPLILLPLIALCLLLGYLFIKPPSIQSITLDPPNPETGQPVTVRWDIDNAQNVELRPLVIGLDPSRGEYTFEQGFPGHTNLTVVASNRFGSVEEPLPISVITPTPTPTPEPGAPVLEEWSVFPTEVTAGQSVTIKWRVSNADSVILEPFGTVDNAGDMEDTPRETKTYRLIATNQGKTIQKSEEVVVMMPPPGAPKIKSFAVEPGSVVKGEVETVRLTWDTEDADTVTIIEPDIGSVALTGNQDVTAPSETTDYILVARNEGGEIQAQARVVVTSPPTPTPTATPTPTPSEDVPGVGAQPDLAVTDIILTEDNKIQCSYQNIGNTEIPEQDVWIEIYVGNEQVSRTNIGVGRTFPAGGTGSLQTGPVDVSGALDVMCKIDADDNVAEADEKNNKFAKDLSVVAVRELGLILTKYPFEDQRVRQAIQMAVGWEELAQKFFPDEYVTLGLGFPEDDSVKASDVRDLTYDPERAKALLAEAGFPDGFGVLLLVWPDEERLHYMAELMKGSLDKAGFKVDLTGELCSPEIMEKFSDAREPAMCLVRLDL